MSVWYLCVNVTVRSISMYDNQKSIKTKDFWNWQCKIRRPTWSVTAPINRFKVSQVIIGFTNHFSIALKPQLSLAFMKSLSPPGSPFLCLVPQPPPRLLSWLTFLSSDVESLRVLTDQSYPICSINKYSMFFVVISAQHGSLTHLFFTRVSFAIQCACYSINEEKMPVRPLRSKRQNFYQQFSFISFCVSVGVWLSVVCLYVNTLVCGGHRLM